MLAVEEAAPAGGAGELRQHRVELAQRLRQVPDVLPRRCRAAAAASGPDRTCPTRPGPRPRPQPGGGEGREKGEKGEGIGPARPLSPPLPPCPAGRWAGGDFMATGGDAPVPLPPPAASDSARARRSPSYRGAGPGRAELGRGGGGPRVVQVPRAGCPRGRSPASSATASGKCRLSPPPARRQSAAPSGGSRCAKPSPGCAPGCCGGRIQRETEPSVRRGCQERLSREHSTAPALPGPMNASRTRNTARRGGSSWLAGSPWFCMRQHCCSATPGIPFLPHPCGIVLASVCGYCPAPYIGEQRARPWGQLSQLIPEDDPRRRAGGRGHAGNAQAQGVTAPGASARLFSGVLLLFLGGRL